MRRIWGYVALVLGLVLIFLVPFLLLYSVPRLEKAPTDTDEQVISIGYGAYFSPKALALTQGPLENIEVLKGNPSASTAHRNRRRPMSAAGELAMVDHRRRRRVSVAPL